jgi:hypothetical protein
MKSTFSKFASLSILITLTLGLFSCEKTDDNKLADAQACLDKLRSTSLDAAALACQSKVDGLTSPQSYVIRCSVGFFLGGIKSSSIVAAYDSYTAAPANLKVATLMGALSSNSVAQADSTFAVCQKSGVSSLIYLAALSQTGTILQDGAGGAGITDPATFISNCANGGAGGICNDAAIGTTVVVLYDSYCMGSAADSLVCTQINGAIQAGGGNPAAIATALYGLLQ